FDRAVVLVSTRGHYSIKKAASMIGIGEENVVTIPVDECNRIDLRRLRRRIRQFQQETERVKVMAVIGIAGTTETGNVDNLAELG
ncbi:pyridoxal-dependent decarboxylase, partial [Klebsiella pneumoniae]